MRSSGVAGTRMRSGESPAGRDEMSAAIMLLELELELEMKLGRCGGGYVDEKESLPHKLLDGGQFDTRGTACRDK